MKIKYFLLFISLLFSLTYTGCGGGGGDGVDTATNNGGWVAISSYYVYTDGSGNSYAILNGTAFVSSSFTAHRCVGLCCLVCDYDDSYPGVDVHWNNQTNGKTGAADSRYGTLTGWEHEWSATIPLIEGTNTIVVTAQDPSGKSGRAKTAIKSLPDTAPPSVNATDPAANSENAPVNLTIFAFFSEEMDPATFNASTFTLSDLNNNPVIGTLSYDSQTATFRPLSALAPNTTYTATLTEGVKDLSGVAMTNGYSWSFKTSWSKTPITEAANNITSSTAQLNGSFQNPDGETTAVWFEYGPTPSFGSETVPESYNYPGTIKVSAALSGLQACTTYYFRIVTENSEGIFFGNEKAFATYTTPQIQVLASDLNAPIDLRLDTANLYWVEIYSDAVKKVPINGGPTSLVASTEMWGSNASLAIDATHLYWADSTTIWTTELVGGPVTTLAAGLNNISSIWVYATDLYLRSDHGIERVDLQSGTVTTLIPAQTLMDFYGGLVVDATGIYFTDWFKGTILKASFDGQQITTLATGLNQPHSLLLDSGFLFWAENNAIRQMHITGGMVTTLVSNVAPTQIAKKGTNIYWTDYYGGTINKVDLDSGAAVTLASAQEKPSRLTVDADSVYWISDGNIYAPPLGSIRKVPDSCF